MTGRAGKFRGEMSFDGRHFLELEPYTIWINEKPWSLKTEIIVLDKFLLMEVGTVSLCAIRTKIEEEDPNGLYQGHVSPEMVIVTTINLYSGSDRVVVRAVDERALNHEKGQLSGGVDGKWI